MSVGLMEGLGLGVEWGGGWEGWGGNLGAWR